MHSILTQMMILAAESAPLAESTAPESAAAPMTLAFAVGLVVAAAVLFFLEMFIPSMGLLTICGIVCVLASVWLGFRHGTGGGMGIMVLNAVLLPFTIMFAFKILPRSPVVLDAKVLGGEPGDVPDDDETKALEGKSGAAITDLRPAGKATIDGRRVDVLTEGAYVSRGTRVTVVRVEGNRIFVRAERVG